MERAFLVALLSVRRRVARSSGPGCRRRRTCAHQAPTAAPAACAYPGPCTSAQMAKLSCKSPCPSCGSCDSSRVHGTSGVQMQSLHHQSIAAGVQMQCLQHQQTAAAGGVTAGVWHCFPGGHCTWVEVLQVSTPAVWIWSCRWQRVTQTRLCWLCIHLRA
jgi:hypothetical protein